MGNCLITKLKATVNNPNLPIIETMQQFTLDAIAASGNSSMTDDQKWALNYFFYQIGAITDSSIYSKLIYLGLPMIAGDLAGATLNYKGNVEYAGLNPRITFQNHYLTSTNTSGTVLSGFVTLNTPISTNGVSVILGRPTATPASFRLSDTNDEQRETIFFDSSFHVDNTPYTSYAKAIEMQITDVNDAGMLLSSSPIGYLYNGEIVVSVTPTVREALILANVDKYTFTFGPNYGIYYSAFGSNLTNEENIALLSALVELKAAFID